MFCTKGQEKKRALAIALQPGATQAAAAAKRQRGADPVAAASAAADYDDDDDVEEAEGWGSEEEGSEEEGSEEEDSAEEQEDGIVPMPGQDLVSVGAMVVGTGASGRCFCSRFHSRCNTCMTNPNVPRVCTTPMFQDGAAAAAMFNNVEAMLHLPDGRVLVADRDNNRIRMLSADLQQVSTVAGDGEFEYRDGAAAQAQFRKPAGLALLPDGRVLVAEKWKHHIRVLSADLQQVSTVAGGGEWRGRREILRGHRDGAAAQAEFGAPSAFALLPDGCVLVTDQHKHCIRMLSADLQQVSTVAGEGEECTRRYKEGYRNGTEGYRDGASAQAQFRYPTGLALLPDGRVLVADRTNHRIRVLSADLQQVSTVAGDGGWGHRDGAAAQAQFRSPIGLALLPDGRVLVADEANQHIRVLSADLQQVSTLTNVGELNPTSLGLLPDGRLLVSTTGPNQGRPLDYHTANRIRVLVGFSAALLST